MLHTDELKRLLRYDEKVFYGRGYLKKIDKTQKVAVIDEDCSMPIILLHCYNYSQKELDEIIESFSREFPELFHIISLEKNFLSVTCENFNTISSGNTITFKDNIKRSSFFFHTRTPSI